MIQKEFTSSQIQQLHEIAEEEVNEMFSDAEEIGSSDISICVRNVLETAKREGLEHTDSNFQLTAIRSIVNQELSNMEAV
tara:strand:+ start:120 stop:359 length:240 start_codon:yes stop_codon:yes gene_type:complete